MSARLATSPAAAPPTPSATAARRGLANTASSLLGRRPTSVRAVHSRVNPVTDGTVTDYGPASRPWAASTAPSSEIRRGSTGISTGSGATECSQTGKSRVP